MKVKETEANHTLREADHPAIKESREAQQEEDHEHQEISSSAHVQEVKKVIDNVERDTLKVELDTLGQEFYSYWDDPIFLELVNDKEFLKKLDAICTRVIYGSRASFSPEDLSQDVLLKLRNWRPRHPGERPPQQLLKAIAINRLIDIHRQPDEQCSSLEELEIEDRSGKMPRHDPVSALQGNIQIRELYRRLKTRKERQLFIAYFIENKRESEIAREHGTSRQAVSNRIDRIIEKLRPYM